MLDEFEKITKKALAFVVLLAVPLVLYFTLFAQEGIFFLSGETYRGAVVPMQIIMPTLLFIGITNILGIQILVPLGREKEVLYSEIIGAIVDIIANAILIPQYASTGAAIGTLLAEFSVLLFQCLMLKNKVRNLFKGINYLNVLVASMLGMILSLGIRAFDISNLGKLVISSLIYFGTYGLFLLLRRDRIVVEIWNTIIKKIHEGVYENN